MWQGLLNIPTPMCLLPTAITVTVSSTHNVFFYIYIQILRLEKYVDDWVIHRLNKNRVGRDLPWCKQYSLPYLYLNKRNYECTVYFNPVLHLSLNYSENARYQNTIVMLLLCIFFYLYILHIISHVIYHS
jgi:hypothetical protein